MDPFETFRSIIYKYVAFPLKAISFNFPNPGFKPTPITWIVAAATIFFSLCAMATCLDRCVESCTQSLMFSLFGLQCAMKAYLGITKHSKLQAKVAFLSKLYKVNLADGKNQDDLKRCGRINLLLTRLYFCVYFVTSVVLICSPIIIYLATNQVMPIMPVRLPFVQNDTVIGFICNAMFNIIMIFLAVCGNLGSEVFILTLWMHEWPMIRILKRAVTTLNQATRGIDHEAIRNSSWLKLHVRNIVLMHKDIYFYVQEVSKLCYLANSVELYTNQLGMILLIYCIVKLKWIAGIFLFGTMFSKLFAYCMLGAAVDLMNDWIYETLTDIDFEWLPKCEQNYVLFMILTSQHPSTMRAGMVKLNLDTFVEVVKTIYSLAMMLMESV